METASDYLAALARHLAEAYQAHVHPQAILLSGSAAEGESDFYSDLDLILYYDALPADEALQAARARVGAAGFRLIAPRTERELAEDYFVGGVECQVAHGTIAAWEADLARVLDDLDVTSPVQKAIGGLLTGVPLAGEARIRQWQERAAAYPAALGRAMVRHYLQVWPLWYLEDRMVVRDAALWVREMLVDGAYHLLGVLAGLNGVYYSPFQFKRLHRFAGTLALAPRDLAARLEAMLSAAQPVAVAMLEALVEDTVALLEAEMPDIDTSVARRRLGERQQPWRRDALPGVVRDAAGTASEEHTHDDHR